MPTRQPVPEALWNAYADAHRRAMRPTPSDDFTTTRAEKIAANRAFAVAQEEWHATRSARAIANGVAALNVIGVSRYPRL